MRYCNENGVTAIIEQSDNLYRKKLGTIYGSYNSNCCNDCDIKMQFVHTSKKVPVLYVKIIG
jgi:hypothetical protein